MPHPILSTEMSSEFTRAETNGDGFTNSAGPANGSAPASPVVTSAAPSSNNNNNNNATATANTIPKGVEEVMYSDIGIATLLNRLKQCIASARDFAAFLKKRSSLEEEQAIGLKRLAKSQLETLRRAEVKTGSYAAQLAEVMRVHERMADNGMQFALSLHQMHEDLNELSTNMERGRKQWKHEGLDAEKRASDAEAAMHKAKGRYDSLAEDYDRARTGDTKGSRRIGLKGPKSAEQYEQDLLRKTQGADQEYEERVKSAKIQREGLVGSERPKAVKALQELIRECDGALTLQLQKFGMYIPSSTNPKDNHIANMRRKRLSTKNSSSATASPSHLSRTKTPPARKGAYATPSTKSTTRPTSTPTCAGTSTKSPPARAKSSTSSIPRCCRRHSRNRSWRWPSRGMLEVRDRRVFLIRGGSRRPVCR